MSDTHNLIRICIGIPCSFLSLVSTSFVFILYIWNPTLQSFPFRLIVYLQISDFIMSFGQFLNLFKRNLEVEEGSDENSFLCQLQAYLCQYGALSTIIWTIIITKMILVSFKPNVQKIDSHEKSLVFFGFYFTGIYSTMYFIHFILLKS